MVRRKAETFEPVTMGHIRGHGCRDLLVYCNSGRPPLEVFSPPSRFRPSEPYPPRTL
jgi:hypothetical protein